MKKDLLKLKGLPKNRDFLGLVDNPTPYWDIFFWATTEDGVRKGDTGFCDRGLFSMPKLIRWEELPEIDEV